MAEPKGKTLEELQAEGWKSAESDQPSTAPDAMRPSVSARAGVPAAGRGSQIDPDQSMRGLEAATTPLAHPTGVDAIDSFTSPVGLASLAAGGVGIARAGMAEGAAAAGKAAVGTAAPFVKYEVVKSGLTSLGVPHWLAASAAAYVSAHGPSGAPASAEAAEAQSAAHLDRSIPTRASSLTQEQIAERVKSGYGTPEAVPGRGRMATQRPIEAPATAPTAAESAVTGEVKPAPPVIDPQAQAVRDQTAPYSGVSQEAKTAKPKMTPDEYAEASRQVKNGIPKDEAIDNVRRARELASMFGSPSAATVAEDVAARNAKYATQKASSAAIVDKIKELASTLKDKGYASPEAEAIKVISDGNPATFGKLMTLYMRSRSVKP